jgi:hypothetical protein
MRTRVRVAGLAMLLYAFLFVAQGMAQQTDDCFVTKEQLKALLGSPDMTLIDMRFGRDWTDATLKIKGAVREDPMKPGQWIDKYPKDKMLVFY